MAVNIYDVWAKQPVRDLAPGYLPETIPLPFQDLVAAGARRQKELDTELAKRDALEDLAAQYPDLDQLPVAYEPVTGSVVYEPSPFAGLNRQFIANLQPELEELAGQDITRGEAGRRYRNLIRRGQEYFTSGPGAQTAALKQQIDKSLGSFQSNKAIGQDLGRGTGEPLFDITRRIRSAQSYVDPQTGQPFVIGEGLEPIQYTDVRKDLMDMLKNIEPSSFEVESIRDLAYKTGNSFKNLDAVIKNGQFQLTGSRGIGRIWNAAKNYLEGTPDQPSEFVQLARRQAANDFYATQGRLPTEEEQRIYVEQAQDRFFDEMLNIFAQAEQKTTKDVDIGAIRFGQEQADRKPIEEALPAGVVPPSLTTGQNEFAQNIYQSSDGKLRVRGTEFSRIMAESAERQLKKEGKSALTNPLTFGWYAYEKLYAKAFEDNMELNPDSELFQGLKNRAKLRGFVSDDMSKEAQIKGVSDYFEWTQSDPSVQAFGQRSNDPRDYKNINAIFAPGGSRQDASGSGIIGVGNVVNRAVSMPDGKLVSGQEFAKDYKGYNFNYNSTVVDYNSPYEYGSHAFNISDPDGEDVQTIIVSPSVTTKKSIEYFQNALQRANQGTWGINYFDLPAGNLVELPPGKYQSMINDAGNTDLYRIKGSDLDNKEKIAEFRTIIEDGIQKLEMVK